MRRVGRNRTEAGVGGHGRPQGGARGALSPEFWMSVINLAMQLRQD